MPKDERKNHKYVARIPAKKKTKKRKWRYFYDMDAYRKYLNGSKKKVNEFKDNMEDLANNTSKKVRKTLKKLDKTKDKYVKKVKKKVDEVKEKIKKKKLSKMLPQIEKGAKMVEKLAKKATKYLAKVKLPNGKWRYFYDKDEYAAYLKREEYQENEPDFMKKIREIDDVFTPEQDMSEINEKYNGVMENGELVRYLDYMMNCPYCTTAYELRRRGYDVEAAPNPDGATFWDIVDWYEGAEIFYVGPDGSTKSLKKYTDMSPKKGTEAWYDDDVVSSSTKYKSPEVIEKSIAKNSGKNSRGNLCVYWTTGGGHSMAYEVDGKGKVTIRDCQTNEIVPMDYLTRNACNFNYLRTDNLEITKEILETVYDNQTEEALNKKRRKK